MLLFHQITYLAKVGQQTTPEITTKKEENKNYAMAGKREGGGKDLIGVRML